LEALVCTSGPVVVVVVVETGTGIEVEAGAGVEGEDATESLSFGTLISSLLWTTRAVDCEDEGVVEKRVVVGDVGEVGEGTSTELGEKRTFELTGSCVVSPFEELTLPIEGVGALILILGFIEIGVAEIVVVVGAVDAVMEVVVVVEVVRREADVTTSSRLGNVNFITLSGFVVYGVTLSLSVSERFRFLLALVEFVVKFGVVGGDVLIFPLFFTFGSLVLTLMKDD
jgi:hypothetical protein